MLEEPLAVRRIELTDETMRCWATAFGLSVAPRLRSTASVRADTWHVDAAVVTINGNKHWRWRAIDPQGAVLDVRVQSRRDTAAAQRLMRRRLKRDARPRVIVTDKRRRDAAANPELGRHIEHRQPKGWNNRAENSAPAYTSARKGDARRQVCARAVALRIGPWPGFAPDHGMPLSAQRRA